MLAYLDEHGANFDALMSASDSFALGALAALQRAGLRVPDDVAVMGCGDVDEARTTVPPLSTARQPWSEQAGIVIDHIVAQWEGEPAFDTETVRAEFIARRSCGCFESSVEHAGHSDRPQASTSREMALELAMTEMLAVLAPVRGRVPWDTANRLIRAFETDLAEGTAAFRSLIEEVAQTMALEGVPVRALQELVTAMRRALLPVLGADDDTARRRRAEDLWQQARVICADAAERRQLARVEEAEGVTRVLADAGRALITTFDTPTLTQALLAELPPLGISACYLLLFEGDESPPSEARLLVAHDTARPLGVPEAGVLIASRELVPPEFLPRRRHSLALIPLCFESDQLGVVLFEIGTKSSIMYEALAEMLSASLKGARLRLQLSEEAAQRAKAERERLVQELEIATRIQTSILPRDLRVEGLEIAAAMRPATEVGGDYYDVLPVEGGAWLGIGDVAGHGLRPGVIMVMLQSVVATAVAQSPAIRPREVVQITNRVLYQNVRERLQQDEHATLSVLRYEKSGHLSYAGAHEELVVYRAETGRTETFETPGTWVAATLDIEDATVDSELVLAPGDILLLYTDGVIEATNRDGQAYGLERLRRTLETHAAESVHTIRDRILHDVSIWLDRQLDDIALLVARQQA
jgi:serine phosphatase RsbU (regulator of sigma subunit)